MISSARIPDKYPVISGARIPDKYPVNSGSRIPDKYPVISGARIPDKYPVISCLFALLLDVVEGMPNYECNASCFTFTFSYPVYWSQSQYKQVLLQKVFSIILFNSF